MAKRCASGKTGPQRQHGSATKQLCGYKLCKSKRDVKNNSQKLQLSIAHIQKDKCRQLRSDCKIVKFCSEQHLRECKKRKEIRKRGGRVALNVPQVVKLFGILASRAPWAAVMMLIQLFLGERADAARQVRWSWLLQSKADCPPNDIQIPACNKKTTPRRIGLYEPFARLLHQWTKNPLRADNGEQWPAEGQQVWADDLPLFPGYDYYGQLRQWAKPISEKAFYDQVRNAAKVIGIQRQEASAAGEPHCYDNVDLRQLGTHSMKKTAVSLMAETQTSWAVISAITGTSIQTLQLTYDIATTGRQTDAMKRSFSGVLSGMQAEVHDAQAELGFCGLCGLRQSDPAHAYCRKCGAAP